MLQVDDDCRRDVVTRLRRVQGQVAGIIGMIEAGRECADIVTQLAAVSKALDRAGLKIVSNGLQQCLAAQERGETPAMTPDQLERLFLALA